MALVARAVKERPRLRASGLVDAARREGRAWHVRSAQRKGRLASRREIVLTTIDNPLDYSAMSTNTMSFALPQARHSYVDQRVRAAQYGNTSEYLCELIRRDQEDQAKKRLRELIEEGMDSGPGRVLTPQLAARLKKQALDDQG